MKELIEIQNKLKAPKNQRNDFGKYNYRSCEDILEAVKPLLKATECTLTLSDEMAAIGDRIYVKATATLTNSANESVTVFGWAREAETKKGMDDSQVTGATSSYARKYALNGLFAIDDNKDPDTNEYKVQQDNSHQQQVNEWIDKFNHAATMEEVKNTWAALPKELQKELAAAKDCAKNRVTNG